MNIFQLTMEKLEELASLIRIRNSIDEKISAVIGRPAEKGHVGEYIAHMIFGIKENASATQKGHDGIFLQGPLTGKTVNVKFYGKLEGILDLQPKYPPDYYLVLAGTRSAAGSSRGKTRPWTIESVFLFASDELHNALQRRGVKLGIASSVRKELWDEAELYPIARNGKLVLTDEQRKLLNIFKF